MLDWRWIGDKPFPELMLTMFYMAPYGVTKPQLIKVRYDKVIIVINMHQSVISWILMIVSIVVPGALICDRNICGDHDRFMLGLSPCSDKSVNFMEYSALPIYRGHLSPSNSRKTSMARPLGQGMGVFRVFKSDRNFTFKFVVLGAISCYIVLWYIEICSMNVIFDKLPVFWWCLWS